MKFVLVTQASSFSSTRQLAMKIGKRRDFFLHWAETEIETFSQLLRIP
jgi:hypothetical protein